MKLGCARISTTVLQMDMGSQAVHFPRSRQLAGVHDVSGGVDLRVPSVAGMGEGINRMPNPHKVAENPELPNGIRPIFLIGIAVMVLVISLAIYLWYFSLGDVISPLLRGVDRGFVPEKK